MQDTENTSFYLDKETIDALRLESQAVSPKEKADFDELVSKCHRKFLDKFGDYLDNSVHTTQLKDKFILTDVEMNKAYQSSWVDTTDKRIHKYEDDPGVFRAFSSEGNFVVGIQNDVWDRLSPENQNDIISNTGSESNARKFVKKAIHQNYVLHEMTHLYQSVGQDTQIPLWLYELQAYWVGRELSDEDTRVHNSLYDSRADYFQELLDEHGEELLQVCFSRNTGYNKLILHRAKSQFTEKTQKKLFPDYKIEDPI
ncbi:hypothetical protein C4564_00090 [Candidatus Microgenomates bacterium]|nr:MAG: hypothetical protein C4564_00090 [Candidatus Microgenomates bacterium]